MRCSNCEQEFYLNIPENHITLKMYKITMITWTCNRCNTANTNIEYVKQDDEVSK